LSCCGCVRALSLHLSIRRQRQMCIRDSYKIVVGAPDQSPAPFRTASGQRIESAVEKETQAQAGKLR